MTSPSGFVGNFFHMQERVTTDTRVPSDPFAEIPAELQELPDHDDPVEARHDALQGKAEVMQVARLRTKLTRIEGEECVAVRWRPASSTYESIYRSGARKRHRLAEVDALLTSQPRPDRRIEQECRQGMIRHARRCSPVRQRAVERVLLVPSVPSRHASRERSGATGGRLRGSKRSRSVSASSDSDSSGEPEPPRGGDFDDLTRRTRRPEL